MQIQIIIQWVLLVVLIGFIISRFMPAKGVSNISVQDAKAMVKDKNIQFIDVRTAHEFNINHRKPFINIPLAELESKTKELEKDREVVVICQSGMRSTRASRIFKKHGFKKVSNVKGGMSAW